MKKYLFILIIFFKLISSSYSEIVNYECLYDTTAIGENIKKRDFMLDSKATIKVDFDEQKLIDYPYKMIANQTEYSRDKAYGVIWGNEEVNWKLDIKTSSLQKKFYTLRINRVGGTLTESRWFDEDRIVIHFYNCNKSFYNF